VDRSTRRLLILAGVGTTALVTRVLLPSPLTRLLNRGLARMPGYRAKVGAVDLNLVKGMIAVRGISLRQLPELDHNQSLYTRLVSLHVDWKSAISGKLVARLRLTARGCTWV
jgi:hypothetical protein